MSEVDFNSMPWLDETVDVDTAALPEQFTPRDPLPQPGRNYLFLLPKIDISQAGVVFKDATSDYKGKSVKRLAAQFGVKDAPGTAIRVLKSPHPGGDNAEFRWRCTNEEKSWDKDDKDAEPGSAMAYLLTALEPGISLPKGSTNRAYANALIAFSGRPFKANVSWSTACNKKNDVWMYNPETSQLEQQKGVRGCGQRYGMKAKTVGGGPDKGAQVLVIPHDSWIEDDGQGGEVVKTDPTKFAERWTCAGCGASLSAFIELSNLRGLEPQDWDVVEALGVGIDRSVMEGQAEGQGGEETADEVPQPATPAPKANGSANGNGHATAAAVSAPKAAAPVQKAPPPPPPAGARPRVVPTGAKR